MATLVFFHAHPDDEAIATGGTMARAAASGHRVVLVTATRGEEGEYPDGFLSPDEDLAAVRTRELHRAADLLGVGRVELLGYRDSGMMGETANGHVGSFWRADVEEAATRLAALLVEEAADVLTVYDDHGGYGHPDHIQVHRVGHRAAQLAGTPRVLEATFNRDLVRRWRRHLADQVETAADRDDPGIEELGTPDEAITTAVDVVGVIDVKRRAMAAHASQIHDGSWFFQLPEEVFRLAFGTEWFVRVHPGFEGDPVANREVWLLPDAPTPTPRA